MEAILSATALGGEIMLHPEELGRVLPRYYVDLILVDGNPLDDITLLSGHTHLDVVMVVGRSSDGGLTPMAIRTGGFTRSTRRTAHRDSSLGSLSSAKPRLRI